MEYPLRDGKGSKAHSFKEINMPDDVKIGVFQGSRGARPDFDIIVKYQEKGKRVRTPQHLHWTIDLLLKKEHNPKLTMEFVKFLIDMWQKVEQFRTKAEQQKCELKVSAPNNLKKFVSLDEYGEYTVEFIATVLELIMIQEKTGNAEAFMFRELLGAIYSEKDIFSIVASARYNGR